MQSKDLMKIWRLKLSLEMQRIGLKVEAWCSKRTNLNHFSSLINLKLSNNNSSNINPAELTIVIALR